jgi:hypothetical protein
MYLWTAGEDTSTNNHQIPQKCMTEKPQGDAKCSSDDFDCICKASNSFEHNTEFDQQCVYNACVGDIGKEGSSHGSILQSRRGNIPGEEANLYQSSSNPSSTTAPPSPPPSPTYPRNGKPSSPPPTSLHPQPQTPPLPLTANPRLPLPQDRNSAPAPSSAQHSQPCSSSAS